jgi:protein TonB
MARMNVVKLDAARRRRRWESAGHDAGKALRAVDVSSPKPDAAGAAWPKIVLSALLHVLAAVVFLMWPPGPLPSEPPLVVSLVILPPPIPPAPAAPPRPAIPVEKPAAKPETKKEATAKPLPLPPPKPKPRPKVETAPPQSPQPPPSQPAPPQASAPAPTAVIQQPTAAPPPVAPSAAPPSYAALLLKWLEQHREYPRLARLQGIQGTVTLSLTLGRSGSVVAAAIRESSGQPLLDQATLDMVRRADPFPPLPAALGRERIEFLVPVRFALAP